MARSSGSRDSFWQGDTEHLDVIHRRQGAAGVAGGDSAGDGCGAASWQSRFYGAAMAAAPAIRSIWRRRLWGASGASGGAAFDCADYGYFDFDLLWPTITAMRRCFRGRWRRWAKPGDVLVGISTSGNSRNVVKALETAKEHGRDDGGVYRRLAAARMAALADHLFAVPSRDTARVQEAHILAGHMFATGWSWIGLRRRLKRLKRRKRV
jgi:hypothetical protein